MLDTKAIELAAGASKDAERAYELAGNNHKEAMDALSRHVRHDEVRFENVTTKISDGFRGMYNRLWGFALLLLGGLGSLAIGAILIILGT